MAQLINPATLSEIQHYDDYPGTYVDKILDMVKLAQDEWARTSIKERTIIMAQLGETLKKKKAKLASICSQEMGKLIQEAEAEIEKCATTCAYYAKYGEKFLQDDFIQTEATESFITYRPLGVVLAIMPWNFPFWQVIRFAAPALCAGNGCVLKHASNVPGCSMALEEVFLEAGFPKNLFRSLIVPAQDVARVIAHKNISAVTITGSTKAGKQVAKVAGEYLKKVVLELGGSDAYLVLKDADLLHAAKTLVKGRMLNAGQSCISPKRLLVDRSVYQEFTKLVESELRKCPPIAPLARADLRSDLHEQVVNTIQQGARCLVGGMIPEGKGAYYPPTLLADVKPGMTAFEEELFGPVVCLIPGRDEEELIRLANQSQYGLGGGIFSRDLNRARKIAVEKLSSGGVFINDFLKSDPRLPFGGIKESGHGRELSFLGIKEFVNAKTISVNNPKEV